MKYYEVDFSIHTDNETVMQDARDLLAALAGEAGFETFEDTDKGIKGYVQTCLFDSEALSQALDDFPFEGVRVTYDIREAEDKDWNEQWENEGFEPIVIGDKCVIHDGRHLPDCPNSSLSIEIDARMAFGTGTHETTRMMVSALLDTDLRGKDVLDCGCGTGILGIAALKGGAGSATGYDIDEWSVDNSRHNAVINRVDDRYEALHGDASLLGRMSRRFDVVMANINRNILLNDMPEFRKVMKKKCTLLLSGFYEDDIGLLREKAAGLGLSITGRYADNGWACLRLTEE